MEAHEVGFFKHAFGAMLLTFSFSDMPVVSEHHSYSATCQSNFEQEKTPTAAMTKPVWMRNGISETLTTKRRK